jgi:sugar lactone lactonase YvrE
MTVRRSVLQAATMMTALILLSACGGGGSGSDSPSSQVTAPVITTQPQSTTVTAGKAATFTVAASGTAPLSYQWQRGGAAISGATSASYSTAATTAQDNGATFTVVVGNAGGSATSSAATLTVNSPPSITTQPSSTIASAGQNATLSVVATGTAPLTYQWKRNGQVISGATNATLTLSPATAEDHGAQFTVDITNSVGTVTSNAASVTIAPPIAVLAGRIGGSGNLNGAVSNARLGTAGGLAIGGPDLYIIDGGYSDIRVFDPANGNLSVFAGSGTPGTTDGTGSAAQFDFTAGVGALPPTAIAEDSSGNLYVCDSGNSTIRKISPSGAVTTLAGVPNTTGFVDGTGSQALFNGPRGITYDAIDNALYVADTGNSVIRRVSLTGVVTTVAGGAAGGYSDGVGSAAGFTLPEGITSPCSGGCLTGAGSHEIYIADTYNDTIREITISGSPETYTVTTIAGLARTTGSTDGAGNVARLYEPEGIAYVNGLLYVADTGNHTVRELVFGQNNSVTVSTLAGTAGTAGYANGIGAAASFVSPDAMSGWTDPSSGQSEILVSDGPVVRAIDANGTVTTLVGVAPAPGSADGTGAAARFAAPGQMAVDSHGNVFVVDSQNYTIRKITPGGVVTTFAGSAGQQGAADGIGASARFWYPEGIAIDASDNLYVSDLGDAFGTVIGGGGTSAPPSIRKITPDQIVSTVIASSSLGDPYSLAIDSSENLYVLDTAGCAIDKVTPTLSISTLAGGQCGSADGTGGAAQFSSPVGLAIDAGGTLFVADTGNDTIRKVTPAGVVTTVAGAAGKAGYVDAQGAVARFDEPLSIESDSGGNLYVTDYGNHVVRKIDATGTVKTIVGAQSSIGVQPGALPGSLSNPDGILVLPGTSTSLAITDENAVLTVSLP